LGDLGVDGRIKLKRILNIVSGLDSSVSGYVPLSVSCERSNDPSDSKRGMEFHEQLSTYQLLNKGCVPIEFVFQEI